MKSEEEEEDTTERQNVGAVQYAVANVVPRFEWQSSISQSERADETRTPLIRPPLVPSSSESLFFGELSLIELDRPTVHEWEVKRSGKTVQIRRGRHTFVGPYVSRRSIFCLMATVLITIQVQIVLSVCIQQVV